MSKFLKQSPKLLAAAAALTIAGLAQAEVTVYGLIDLSYGKNEYNGDTKADFHSGGDNGSFQGNSTSRVGTSVSNEVAPGLKANAKLETGGIESDGTVNGGGAFFNRQMWAGFSGGFGEVRLGKQDSVSFQTHIGFDFNGAANAASALFAAGVSPAAPAGRQSRSLQYISPEFSGLKAQVGFQPEAATDPTTKSNYGLGATYTRGAFAAAVSAQSKTTQAGDDAYGVSASYDLGVAKVMVSYADNGDILKGGSGKGYGLGVVAPVAGFNVGAIYGANSEGNENKAIELFVNREIFKNTFAYFDYGKLDSKNAAVDGQQAYALGVIYAF